MHADSSNSVDSSPPEAISWLHITDWHVGQEGHSTRWPNFRDSFERDVKLFIRRAGGLDIVFFTGDLVQSGSEPEFEELERHLDKLWSVFRETGCEPKLVVVPGNHDLQRPSKNNPTAIALRAWATDSFIRDAFWDRSDSTMRDEVSSWFHPFTRWLSVTKIPMLPPIAKGALPGDALYSFRKGQLSVGILGLNATYLQHRSGNLEGQLALSPSQIPVLPKGDYVVELKKHDVTVLLTHQPQSWLTPDSKLDFESDIAPSGRFDVHFCGHLHIPNPISVSRGGAPRVHQYQGTSFFGLDSYGDDQKVTRNHGYLGGRWIRSHDVIQEACWPRVAVQKHDNSWGLGSDQRNYLDENESSERSWASRSDAPLNGARNCETAATSDWTESSPRLIDQAPPNALSRFPRLRTGPSRQHLAIRTEERAKLRGLLQHSGTAFVVCDWGAAKDEFVATTLSEIVLGVQQENNTQSHDCAFVLKCDAFEHVSDFETGFRHQFGVSVHQFLSVVVGLEGVVLILDGVQPALTTGDEKNQFSRLCSIIRDFAPSIKLIITGRLAPGDFIPQVQIGALDPPETRLYLASHPLCQETLLSMEAVERLHFASGGLPLQIDRLLDRLQVASLEAVLDEESLADDSIETDDSLHKSLTQCLRAISGGALSFSQSKTIVLLKALCVLPYGETIEGVKHFMHGVTLQASDAKLLLAMALIEAIPICQNNSAFTSKLPSVPTPSTSPKILRVPKQVRDCVWSQMDSGERRSYLYAAAEFIFGKKWRAGGRIKMRHVPPEYRDYVSSGLGNEYAVISSLIAYSISVGNDDDLRRAIKLGLHFCGVLKGADRNRDLKMVSKSLLRSLNTTDFRQEVAALNALCGRACRLTRSPAEAVGHLADAVAFEIAGKRKEAHATLLIEQAIALEALDEDQRALSVLEQAKPFIKANSLLESQFNTQLSGLVNKRSEHSSELQRYEANARSKNWASHANDLAMVISSYSKNAEERIAWLDKVLRSGESGWNLYRAIIQKADVAWRSGLLEKLSLQDRVRLREAYAFCHSQRLDSFDECHDALWMLYEQEGNLPYLYSLFRNSSFIWRIRGSDELEYKYYQRLVTIEKSGAVSQLKAIRVEIEYFTKRAKVLVLRFVGK